MKCVLFCHGLIRAAKVQAAEKRAQRQSPLFRRQGRPTGGVETGQVISGTDVALQTGKSQAIATLLALPHEAGEIYRHCRSRSDL